MSGSKPTMHPGRLAIPREVVLDQQAKELLTIWLRADETNTTVVRADIWDDPAAWGLLLADVARHIADAIAAKTGRRADTILARVKIGIEIELDNPTGEAHGGWKKN